MDKEKVKEMVCKAIDNIPDCAEILDCYTVHSYGDKEAYIKLRVEVKKDKENDEDSLIDLASFWSSRVMHYIM